MLAPLLLVFALEVPVSGTDILPTLVQRIPEGVSVTVAIVFTVLYLKDRRAMMRDAREAMTETREAFLEALDKLEERQDKRGDQIVKALEQVAERLDGRRRVV